MASDKTITPRWPSSTEGRSETLEESQMLEKKRYRRFSSIVCRVCVPGHGYRFPCSFPEKISRTRGARELKNQGERQTPESLSEIMSIDRLVHSPARLAILTYLSVVEEGDAVYLLNQTGLTWGNLSANVTRLQEAGYIEVVKEFKDKKPHTLLKMTAVGRKAFHDYLNTMKGLLDY